MESSNQQQSFDRDDRFDTMALRRNIFRLRLISSRPRRMHPSDGKQRAQSLEKRSTTLNSSVSPPRLPNVVHCDEPEPEAKSPRPPKKIIINEECPPSPDIVNPDLPRINVESTSPINSAKGRLDKAHTLDVPLPIDRHRADSLVTQHSVSSSNSFLTTPSNASFSGMDGEDSSRPSSRLSFMVKERLHSLAMDINRRTNTVKQHIQQPPTPDNISISSLAQSDNEDEKKSVLSLDADFGVSPRSLPTEPPSSLEPVAQPRWKKTCNKAFIRKILPYSIDPQSRLYLIWLIVVSLCFLYNAYAIPLRAAYPYQTEQTIPYWLCADYVCDIVYIIDLVMIKPRIRFSRNGLPVKERKETRKHYLNSWYFKQDLFSLLPLDILYLVPSLKFNSLLRLPRMLKARAYLDMFYMIDNSVKNPYLIRIGKTLSYMIFMIHCNGCVYYTLSNWEGIGSNGWAYNGDGNMYLRCFYFATKLATSIGNNPDPKNVIEYIYMTVCWMLGVFVFALLLGQIRDVVATATKNQETFRHTMDAALDYCAALNLPKKTRDKVREWFIYTWQEQKTLNENRLLEKLPRKLQTDLAISVHYQVLNKVQLFQDCDKALLRDLVLKLKPALFLPGDYICKKGEVGKDMYIVNKGVLEVVGGPNNELVFATLKEGSAFGEISLLALAGGNRRTADVRSKGFSNLFVLSKDDLNETIRDYPDAQRVLRKKAKKLIKSDEQKKAARQTDIEKACEVSAKVATPKLLPVVAQMLDSKGHTGLLLQRMLQEDEANRADIRRQSQASNTSSIVDDVMAGMSIDKVIERHYGQNVEIPDPEATSNEQSEYMPVIPIDQLQPTDESVAEAEIYDDRTNRALQRTDSSVFGGSRKDELPLA